MKYITDTLDFVLNRRSVITLGKFDGLHRGHEKLINRILEIGRDGYETVIFTFDVSPVVRLKDQAFRTLLTNDERRELASVQGVDCFIECPFVPEIMNMKAEDFIKEILVDQLKAGYLVVGPDFHFGYQRRGNPQMLVEMGTRYGFRVDILDKVMDGEKEISSTYIREEILKGNMEKANELLGYPYFVNGPVIHGRKLGRTIGVPTINQLPEVHKLLPPFGVYASITHIGGKVYQGISNIGVKPTVGEHQAGVETYLFECSEDLYGLDVRVELCRFQRPEYRFESLEALQHQMRQDEQSARKYFKNIR